MIDSPASYLAINQLGTLTEICSHEGRMSAMGREPTLHECRIWVESRHFATYGSLMLKSGVFDDFNTPGRDESGANQAENQGEPLSAT
jgi:hypothetical protein